MPGFPSLVNYLPNRVYLTSENSPPPSNPRLQHCLETSLFDEYDLRRDDLTASIDRAAALDLSYLPEDLRRDMKESIESARSTFDRVADVRAADTALANYIPQYEPVHRQARASHVQIARLDREQQELAKKIGRLSRAEDAAEGTIAAMERRIEELTDERTAYEALIPSDWESAREQFVALADAEKKARLMYRRNVDDAYEPLMIVRGYIGETEELSALQPQLEALGQAVRVESPEEATETFKAAEAAVGAVDGTSAIRSKLSKARREFKGDDPDRPAAATLVTEALALYADEVAWRQLAAGELADGLEAYDAAIRDTIGIRMQERLSTSMAKDIAGCLSSHRDISLNF